MPPSRMDPAVPPPLIRFVEMFNRGEFWESHEVLEGPWRQGGSPFYQGLILYASAFVHAQRKNAHGVRAQMDKAIRALGPSAPSYLGVDVDEILIIASAVRNDPAGEGWQGPPPLVLDPARIRGDEPELDPPGE